PGNPGNVVMGIYGAGILVALGSALILKKTIMRGDSTPFVMELPPYRAPTLRGLLWHVGEKTLMYAKKAGTVILIASILIWALTAFPVQPVDIAADSARAASFIAAHPGADEAVVEAHVAAERAKSALEHSIAGRLGKALEPIVRPLGFDWRVGVAVVTGFAAKEIVVSTLGVMYAATDEGTGLTEALRADPGFSPLTALGLMLFLLIIPPCFAALATLKAELGWQWLGFSIAYMLALGWGLSFALRSVVLAFGWG
ncbi:MAG: ferrous iron transporter B, partial [Spirochaetales bacterium]